MVVRLSRAFGRNRRKRARVSSTYLVANPSFLTGVARTLDLWGQLDAYNVSATTQQADALALHNDWKVVGQDLIAAAKGHQKRVVVKRSAQND